MQLPYTLRATISDLAPSTPSYTELDYPDLTGKVVLVTGTSAGVGKDVAMLLLAKNATLVSVNRNKEKTILTTEEIIEGAIKVNNKLTKADISARMITVIADLGDLPSIKPAAEEVFQKVDKLDIIILNAGVMQPPTGSVTKQGYELQFGCNVMAHQLLFDLLLPLLKKSATGSGFTPRALFLSSSGHALSPPNGGMSWDFTNTDLGKTLLYGQSKAGNVYQAAIVAQENPDIISLSVHPGWIASELQRHMTLPKFMVRFIQKVIMSPPRYGAYTELWAALNPSITLADSGKYVAPWGLFFDLRDDIQEGTTDGTAKKMMDWVEKEIAQYK